MPGNNFDTVPLWREALGRVLQEAEDKDDNCLRGALEEYSNGRTNLFYRELMLRELYYADHAPMKIIASLYFGMHPDIMACNALVRLAVEDLAADVREAAVLALAHQDDPEISAILEEIAENDGSRSVKVTALMALEMIERRREAVPRGG